MKVTVAKIERLSASAGVDYETARLALVETDGDILEAILLLERQGRIRKAEPEGEDAVEAETVAETEIEAETEPEPETETEPETATEPMPEPAPEPAPAYDYYKAYHSQAQGQAGQTGWQQGQTGWAQGQQQGQQYDYSHNGGAWQGQQRYRDESTAFDDGAKRVGNFFVRLLRAGCENNFEMWRNGRRVLYWPIILFLLLLVPWVFWVFVAFLIIGLLCRCSYRFDGPNIKGGGGGRS
ncbi:MAG: hypothetical protein LBR00_04470 [Clostridiales Family XIII bacterium]|jgi:hypothetical protein|nr:hypothetical protein [Clostridiales Family XIII bacterium]